MSTKKGTYTLLLLGWLRSSYEKDPESGLYYAGARYQVPRLGSFNSTDPLWWKLPDKTSYHYCSNNPIMRVDPDGMADYWWQNETTGEVYYSKNHNKQAVAEVNSFLGNGLLGGDVGNWAWLGEDNMFGDTPDNVLNAYTNGTAGTGLSVFSLVENSEDFMNTHGYKSVPTQIIEYSKSLIQREYTPGGTISLDLGCMTQITEKRSYVNKDYVIKGKIQMGQGVYSNKQWYVESAIRYRFSYGANSLSYRSMSAIKQLAKIWSAVYGGTHDYKTQGPCVPNTSLINQLTKP